MKNGSFINTINESGSAMMPDASPEGGCQNGSHNGKFFRAFTFSDSNITASGWKREAVPSQGPEKNDVVDSNTNIVNEAQLILAEKRTSLAAMRTGIAVFAIPLSVLSLLIATSKYYDIIHVLHFVLPLAAILAALIVLATYLVVRALLHIRKYDRLILRLKRKHSRIAEFLD